MLSPRAGNICPRVKEFKSNQTAKLYLSCNRVLQNNDIARLARVIELAHIFGSEMLRLVLIDVSLFRDLTGIRLWRGRLQNDPCDTAGCHSGAERYEMKAPDVRFRSLVDV